ncbi:MAG: RnfABCDGE type electron transport complex subunit D [Eubacteriales bacterium]|nr:RnfABCDGE type electron transport complex subunit D [Eubacteriales bacterium]
MEGMLHVSSNPHVRDRMTTDKIMGLVVLALLPASAFGIWNFGPRAALILAVSVAASVCWEWLYDLCIHKENTTRDMSAAVTGLLLGLNMPVSVPLWMPVLGCAFAIIVVKQLFGGLGQNFMNPALAGRCFLLISFSGRMTDFTVGSGFKGVVDAVTGATPLAAMKDHGLVEGSVPLKNLFLGNIQGTIGETSVLAILIGAAVLLYFKVIDLRIPLSYLCTFFVFTVLYQLFTGQGFDLSYPLAQLFSGGIMLGAWFMATDYVTRPITPMGQIVFGVCIGLLTGIFRLLGSSPEGVSYAIIFGNLLVPQIERFTQPTAFGKRRKKA